MREIIFRGKRIDTGEWIIGDYLAETSDSPGPWILPIGERDEVKVIEKTVGQFIGMFDKKGQQIFEGDIVRTRKYGKVVQSSNVNGFDVFTVVYEPCMFRLERKNPDRGFNLVGNGLDYEVIGNIHDNPENSEGMAMNREPGHSGGMADQRL